MRDILPHEIGDFPLPLSLSEMPDYCNDSSFRSCVHWPALDTLFYVISTPLRLERLDLLSSFSRLPRRLLVRGVCSLALGLLRHDKP